MGQNKSKMLLKPVENEVAEYPYGIAPSDCVQHYIHPNFPMCPQINAAYLMDCNKTWKLIVTANTDRMRQYGKSGIVLFYDEFFYRLFQRDFTMQDVFPDITKRSVVLIKAMTFILKCSAENEKQVISKCHYLGHRHRFFDRVRPHQFAQYTNTCVEVIMYWLGEYATKEVSEAWSNLMGFFAMNILEAFLHDKVDPFETSQNTVIGAVREISESASDLRDTSTAMSYGTQSTQR